MKSEVVNGVLSPALSLCSRAKLCVGIVDIAQQNHTEMRHAHLGVEYFKNYFSSLRFKIRFKIAFPLSHAFHLFKIADGLRRGVECLGTLPRLSIFLRQHFFQLCIVRKQPRPLILMGKGYGDAIHLVDFWDSRG